MYFDYFDLKNDIYIGYENNYQYLVKYPKVSVHCKKKRTQTANYKIKENETN